MTFTNNPIVIDITLIFKTSNRVLATTTTIFYIMRVEAKFGGKVLEGDDASAGDVLEFCGFDEFVGDKRKID